MAWAGAVLCLLGLPALLLLPESRVGEKVPCKPHPEAWSTGENCIVSSKEKIILSKRLVNEHKDP